MVKSRIFLFFCLSFLGGIFFKSFFSWASQIILLAALVILGLLFISIFWGRAKLVVIGFCLLFLVLGICRQQLAEDQISRSALLDYNNREEILTFIGLVSAEADIRETNLKLTVSWPEAKGQVLVTASRYPEYNYGDKLKITGKLEAPPTDLAGFNYQDYLAKDGIYSVIYYPKIELLDRGQGNFLLTKILSFKNSLRKVINQNLSPPQSALLAAIILGDKRQISPGLGEKLNRAGLRHLTAVSGMHVAVLTVILMNLLLSLGFWPRRSFYLLIVLIFFFIVLTGFQVSALRAGLMAVFFLLAKYLGRPNNSSRAIVLAAVLILTHNPLLLKLDIGFQLSFLALLGIIYLSPLGQRWLAKVPINSQIKNLLIITLSAQIFTLPILVYNFGYFSIVAPLTNLLVVPLLPLLMGLGLLFVLAGTLWGFLGWLFSLPNWLLLTYLVKIIDWFSGLPLAVYSLEISWFWLIIFYLILGLFIWRFNRKSFLKY